MNSPKALDRAVMLLGGVSIISAAFVFVHGDLQLVQIRAAGLVVALVLGLLAVVARLVGGTHADPLDGRWVPARSCRPARHAGQRCCRPYRR
jgi:hypothetical protein